MPVIVKDLTDDEAVIFMVDSNLQRENILPSERALAYKMKMEALKHQGQRNNSTLVQVIFLSNGFCLKYITVELAFAVA